MQQEVRDTSGRFAARSTRQAKWFQRLCGFGVLGAICLSTAAADEADVQDASQTAGTATSPIVVRPKQVATDTTAADKSSTAVASTSPMRRRPSGGPVVRLAVRPKKKSRSAVAQEQAAEPDQKRPSTVEKMDSAKSDVPPNGKMESQGQRTAEGRLIPLGTPKKDSPETTLETTSRRDKPATRSSTPSAASQTGRSDSQLSPTLPKAGPLLDPSRPSAFPISPITSPRDGRREVEPEMSPSDGPPSTSEASKPAPPTASAPARETVPDPRPVAAKKQPLAHPDSSVGETKALRTARRAAPPAMLAPDLLPDAEQPPRALDSLPTVVKPTEADTGVKQVLADVHAAKFQGVTPGKTDRETLINLLGEPGTVDAADAFTVMTYVVGPFPKVEFHLSDQTVQSIVIHLPARSVRDAVASELQLTRFRSVPISDNRGQLLGEVYPERGLMFAYSGEGPMVGQVVLESISAEPFLLRAESEADRQYGACLADLAIVEVLGKSNAQAYGQAAEVHAACGQISSALAAAHRALALAPQRTDFQLLVAELTYRSGQNGDALDAIETLLAQQRLTGLEEARAHLLRARLLASTPPRNYKRAMDEAVDAIKLLAQQVSEGRQRAAARHLLVHCELALAEIIAYGPWETRHEVVPQWLNSAEKTAQKLLNEDGGHQEIMLSVYGSSLHCLDALQGKGVPTDLANAAIKLGRELIATAEDDDYRASIEWELGTALWHAARAEYRHDRPDDALRYANNADALLVAAGESRQDCPETDHHLGQLQFLIGAVYGILKQDDVAAVEWYDKARPRLTGRYPQSLIDEQGATGEQLISVGVSYWNTNRKEEAVKVTQEGLRRIEQAVRDGAYGSRSLSVPLENLASMQRALGNAEEADRLASRAAEIK